MGDDAQLAQLSACLQQSLSPDPAVRTQAEQFLKDGSVQPGFPMLLMRLLASEGSDAAVRQGAAVTFKNLVKNNWVEKEADVVGAPAPYSVAAGEKEQVRAMLVGLMLGAPRLVQAQLSEALSIVSAADFPDRWPGLLPELIQRMGTPGARDFNAVVGVLTTANTIFKRYRQAYKSDELYKELKYVLDTFAGPLLVLLKEVSAAIDSNAGNLELLVNLFKCLRLICRVFYSLNSQELPEVFEDNMDAWMGEFHKFLCYDNPQLAAVDNKDREKAGAVDQVKAAICDNVNLYIEKNEEEFQRFLQTFVQDVWTLLTKTGLEPNKDHLVTSGVRFLTTVANSVHHRLFAGGDTLRQVCESIVIPNLQFREDDEELFESNHVEYIRRDIEGSDSDTRRRGACELVKGLTAKFPEVMTQSVSGYVTALLGQYAADPHNAWKAKDAAVYLVISLVVKSKSVVKGATETNDLVSITDFFTQQIAPELARAASGDAAGGTGRHVLYADALKFLTIFRSQIPKQMAVQALPAVVTLLASRENVVHTYAANALERTLTVRDHPPVGSPPGTRSTLRYTPGDIQPYAQQMLQNLFNVFAMPDSSENEYAMKATMRLISFMGDAIKPIAGVCLERLSGMVMETCKNPRNPTFSHYLFESVAALVKAGAGDPGLIATFESATLSPVSTRAAAGRGRVCAVRVPAPVADDRVAPECAARQLHGHLPRAAGADAVGQERERHAAGASARGVPSQGSERGTRRGSHPGYLRRVPEARQQQGAGPPRVLHPQRVRRGAAPSRVGGQAPGDLGHPLPAAAVEQDDQVFQVLRRLHLLTRRQARRRRRHRVHGQGTARHLRDGAHRRRHRGHRQHLGHRGGEGCRRRGGQVSDGVPRGAGAGHRLGQAADRRRDHDGAARGAQGRGGPRRGG